MPKRYWPLLASKPQPECAVHNQDPKSQKRLSHWLTRRLPMLFLIGMLSQSFLTQGEIIIDLDGKQAFGEPANEDHVKSPGSGYPDSDSLSSGLIDRSGLDVRKSFLEEQRRILRVGPARNLKTPSDAARIARDGDVIEIDPAVYTND